MDLKGTQFKKKNKHKIPRDTIIIFSSPRISFFIDNLPLRKIAKTGLSN